MIDFTHRVDEYVACKALEFPTSECAEGSYNPKDVTDLVLSFDLAEAGIASVIWESGFRYYFDWIDLPILCKRDHLVRMPENKRGLTKVPGV